MITIIEILLFISAMLFVGYPIFRRQGVQPLTQNFMRLENEAFDELVHKKEGVYTSIKDLDFDYRTGKLSEDDYKELKERYELEALRILKEVNEFGQKKATDVIIPSPPLGKGDEGEFIFCPNCGAKTKAGDNFCFKCGAKLPSM